VRERVTLLRFANRIPGLESHTNDLAEIAARFHSCLTLLLPPPTQLKLPSRLAKRQQGEKQDFRTNVFDTRCRGPLVMPACWFPRPPARRGIRGSTEGS
jgi:hypothetical protein